LRRPRLAPRPGRYHPTICQSDLPLRAALERDLRFDPRKAVLDPNGRAIAGRANYGRAAATKPGDNFATVLKSVVTDVSRYDGVGDVPLRRPFSRIVLYEMHVAGFTKHPSPAVVSVSSGPVMLFRTCFVQFLRSCYVLLWPNPPERFARPLLG
jgi:hypothetical protein